MEALHYVDRCSLAEATTNMEPGDGSTAGARMPDHKGCAVEVQAVVKRWRFLRNTLIYPHPVDNGVCDGFEVDHLIHSAQSVDRSGHPCPGHQIDRPFIVVIRYQSLETGQQPQSGGLIVSWKWSLLVLAVC